MEGNHPKGGRWTSCQVPFLRSMSISVFTAGSSSTPPGSSSARSALMVKLNGTRVVSVPKATFRFKVCENRHLARVVLQPLGNATTPGAPGGLDRNIRLADASITRTHGENTAHFTVIHTANKLKHKRGFVDQLGYILSACSVRVTGTRGPRIPNASHGKELPQGNTRLDVS